MRLLKPTAIMKAPQRARRMSTATSSLQPRRPAVTRRQTRPIECKEVQAPGMLTQCAPAMPACRSLKITARSLSGRAATHVQLSYT